MRNNTVSKMGTQTLTTKVVEVYKGYPPSYNTNLNNVQYVAQKASARSFYCSPQGKTNRKNANSHGYSYVDQQYGQGTLTYESRVTDTPTYFYSSVSSKSGAHNILAPGTSGTGTESIARNKAINKTTDIVRGGLDVSIDLAEAHRSISMVRAVGQLETYVRGFSRHTIANKWLEFIFGWKPLVGTLFGTLEELASQVSEMQRVKSRASHVSKSSTTWVSGDLRYADTVTTSNRVEMAFWYKAPSTRLAQIGRYTSLNPASIAWELMTLSFVIDYVIDISSYLRNLETAVIYNGGFSGGYQTTTTKNTCERVATGTGVYGGDGTRTVGSVKAKTVTVTKSRSLMTSYPFPDMPTVNLRLGPTRLLTLAALLTQLLPSQGVKRQARKRITSQKWASSRNKIEKRRFGARSY